MMNASCRMFGFMVKQISKELMMIMLVISPFLVGIFFKFGVPLLESKVLERFGYGDVIKPYYELFSWLLAMLTGMFGISYLQPFFLQYGQVLCINCLEKNLYKISWFYGFYYT